MNESIEINGKVFEYLKPTVGEVKRMSEAFTKLKENPTTDEKAWNKIIKYTFKKNFLWKYFGITPRALKYNNIPFKQLGGIQAGFFEFCRDLQNDLSEQVKVSADLNQKSTT